MSRRSATTTHGAAAPFASGQARRGTRFALWAVLAIAAASYLWLVADQCSFIAGGADSSGYLNAARSLLTRELYRPVPTIEGLQPPGWDHAWQRPHGLSVALDGARLTPSYPVGYPLHLALAAPAVGLDHAVVPANLALVLAAGVLMILVGRRFGLSLPWAIAGAALLWACPLFLFMALQPMSDVAATVWVLAAVGCALVARERWRWGFATGLCTAIAVLVRPTDLLVLVPIALVLGWRLRAWLALAAGAAPGAWFQAWLNTTLYGSPLQTGYGSVGELFAWRWLPHNTLHFLGWTLLLLTPFITVPALVLFVRRGPRFGRAVLLAWTLVFVGFYLFYFFTGETWWFLRFVLPAYPALILAGLLGLRELAHRLPPGRWRTWSPAAALGLAVGLQALTAGRMQVTANKHNEYAYLLAAEWMRSRLPANAVVMQGQTSGSQAYYAPQFAQVRWDLMTADRWHRVREACERAGRPIFALLFSFEERDALGRNIPGAWTRVSEHRGISVWRLADPTAAPADR